MLPSPTSVPATGPNKGTPQTHGSANSPSAAVMCHLSMQCWAHKKPNGSVLSPVPAGSPAALPGGAQDLIHKDGKLTAASRDALKLTLAVIKPGPDDEILIQAIVDKVDALDPAEAVRLLARSRSEMQSTSCGNGPTTPSRTCRASPGRRASSMSRAAWAMRSTCGTRTACARGPALEALGG